jgi:sulfate/thiosulfate transport system permease protein
MNSFVNWLSKKDRLISEARYIRFLLIFVSVIFAGLFLFAPLIIIFIESFSQGIKMYFKSITEPEALAAIKLTLLIVLISVPLNLIFGFLVSWCITKFDFWGKNLLITLIDIPFSVSPIIVGFSYLLIFSINHYIGHWFSKHGIELLFAIPSMVFATIFVTLPFIAKEIIPLMKELGNEEEEAAIMLGASGLQTIFRITLPNIKWGLLYGVLLCTARTIGEFGAVSIVSGHIRGKTETIPLYVETMFNEYNLTAAFAMSSLLSLLAVVALVIRLIMESKVNSKSQV